MGLGSIVGSIGGALIGAGSQANANQANAQLQQQNQAWMKEMSDTAVQRRVADMKKAGINPLLSVSGASAGASTPSSSPATMQRTFDPQMMGSLLTSVANAKVASEEAKKIQAETDRLKGMTPLDMQEKEKMIQKVDSTLQNDRVSRQLLHTQNIHEKAKIINTELQRSDILAGIDLKQKTGSNLINNDELINIQTEVAKLGLSNEKANQLLLEKTRDLAVEKAQQQLKSERYKNNQVGQTGRDYMYGELRKIIDSINPFSGIIK